MTIHLKAQEVAQAVVEAMNNNRLQVQQPHRFYGCMYFDPALSCVCAIGAALPEHTARYFDNLDEASIGDLLQAEEVETDDEVFLANLQQIHDDEIFTLTPSVETFRKKFEQLCVEHGVVL